MCDGCLLGGIVSARFIWRLCNSSVCSVHQRAYVYAGEREGSTRGAREREREEALEARVSYSAVDSRPFRREMKRYIVGLVCLIVPQQSARL